MDANNSNPTAQQNVILALALVLLCRAMWKFLNRVNPDATPDEITGDRINGLLTGTARQQIDVTTSSSPTDDHDSQRQLRKASDQDLNNNETVPITTETEVPADTVDGTILESHVSPFLKNLKQNKIAQGNQTFFSAIFCLHFA